MEKLLALIHRWMKAKKVTQTALSEQMNIRQGSLSMMLSGKTALPKRRLQEIINLLSPSADEAREALLLYGTADSVLQFASSRESAVVLEELGRRAEFDAQEFMTDFCSKGAELRLDLSDPLTYRLLEYWRDMAESKRFELLARIAETEEQKK